VAKYKIYTPFIVILMLLSGCGAPAVSTESVQAPELPPPVVQSTEVPPTPFPDTPVPPEINAPLVDAPALVDIHFVNSLDGWGKTDKQIVRTNDGGITWYNVTPPDLTEAGYVVNLSVLDNDHIWLQKADTANYPESGFLYHTLDGGLTWTSSKDPFSEARLSFLDKNNGWAFVGLGAGAGSDAVAVYQTTDGGSSWNQTYTNDPSNSNAGDSLPMGGLKSGLTPLNMQTAWVSGVVYSDGTVYLYRTDDGGAHWSQVTSLSLPPVAQTTQVGFQPVQIVSAQSAFVTVRIPADQSQMAVYVSNDAGNTWTLTPTLIPNGNQADFLSATEAVIYNGEQFYVTHDAAQTWSQVTPNVAFGDNFALMDFVNTSTGWVLTADADNHRSFYRTDDGGVTWSSVIP